MPCKSDGGVNAVKKISVLTRKSSCCNLVFALLHWYALTEEKHTSFYTEHELCKSAIVPWVPFKTG